MNWVDILGLVTLGFIPAFMLLDLVHHPIRYDAPRFFRLRGVLMSVGVVAAGFGLAWFWGTVLQFPSLLDLSGWNLFAAAGAGILVYELVHYWYHRSAHRFDWLWLAAHQTHHSTESHDAFGANYTSPLDTLAFGSLPILVTVPLLGLSPGASAIVGAFVTFNAMFQHANLRTPRWLGYIVQRPESHALHHERGVHRFNYSDLPLWDILFGTFRNPKEFAAEVGFYKGASARIPAMWAFRDVNQPGEDEGEKTTRVIPTTTQIEQQRAA
ncbi:MAG: sterol desaturase family protein [Planctomycetes bacterium]|nr:sterol desaturase family protein [Planctomycetota bacterium]